jgi:hypothetical protein
MSDKAFEKAMGRIAIEAENERQLEQRRERRQRILSRVRSVGGFLVTGTNSKERQAGRSLRMVQSPFDAGLPRL